MYERLRGVSGARLSYQSNYLEIVAAASKYPFISIGTRYQSAFVIQFLRM